MENLWADRSFKVKTRMTSMEAIARPLARLDKMP